MKIRPDDVIRFQQVQSRQTARDSTAACSIFPHTRGPQIYRVHLGLDDSAMTIRNPASPIKVTHARLAGRHNL